MKKVLCYDGEEKLFSTDGSDTAVSKEKKIQIKNGRKTLMTESQGRGTLWGSVAQIKGPPTSLSIK